MPTEIPPQPTEENPFLSIVRTIHTEKVRLAAHTGAMTPEQLRDEVTGTVLPILENLATLVSTFAQGVDTVTRDLDNRLADVEAPDSMLLPEDAAMFANFVGKALEVIKKAVDAPGTDRASKGMLGQLVAEGKDVLERIDQIALEDDGEGEDEDAPVSGTQLPS